MTLTPQQQAQIDAYINANPAPGSIPPAQPLPTASSNVPAQTSAIASSAQNPTMGTAPQAPTYTAGNYSGQLSALQNLSPEETEAQNQLNSLQESYLKGNQGIADKSIPMQFITGQQQSLENRYINNQIPLQQQLALAQSKRQAAIDVAKIQYETALNQDQMAQNDYQFQQQMNQPISMGEGSSLVDPITGKVISTAPSSYAPSSSGSGSGFTPSQQQGLVQAHIQDPNAASFFLNTPKEFQDSWQQSMASSLASDPNQPYFTVEQVMENYDSWLKAQEKDNWWE